MSARSFALAELDRDSILPALRALPEEELGDGLSVVLALRSREGLEFFGRDPEEGWEFPAEIPETRLRDAFPEARPLVGFGLTAILVAYDGEDGSPQLGVLKRSRTRELRGPVRGLELEETILREVGLPGREVLREFRNESGRPVAFLRPYLDGRTGESYGAGSLSLSDAAEILYRTARELERVRAAGFVLADLQPANLLSDGRILDLGNATRLPPGETVARTYLMNPGWSAPETWTRRVVSEASDIFALGAILSLFVAGKNPYGLSGEFGDAPEDRLRVALLVDRFRAGERFVLPPSEFVGRMTSPEPRERPSLAETIEYLDRARSGALPALSGHGEGAPYALVPMRASVPHAGHLRLLRRVTDLGFRALVSLQQSYTLTPEDPIPKWEVEAMLRVGLRALGVPEGDAEFRYGVNSTPESILLGYTMDARWERVAVVVSGNEDMRRLVRPILDGRAFLDAAELCEGLRDANGTRLREAIRSGNAETIDRMYPAAIRKAYPEDGLWERLRAGTIFPDVPKNVRVQLIGPGGVVVLGMRVLLGLGPERSLRLRTDRPFTYLDTVVTDRDTMTVRYLTDGV